MNQFLPTKIACMQLGIDPDTLIEWARHGKIPAQKLTNGQWRFSQEDINKIIAENMARAKADVVPENAT
jgi:excisionase family DNA binding protein